MYLSLRFKLDKPQTYASALMNVNKYYGYLAWYEILSQSKSTQDKETAGKLLVELVRTATTQCEAHLKLWNFYSDAKSHELALGVIEDAYIKFPNSDYRNLIVLYYGKSLFKTRRNRQCLELFQSEYMKAPCTFTYLLHLGKYCVKSKLKSFLGSAISALKECLGKCHWMRRGQTLYWLGKAYTVFGERRVAVQFYQEALPELHRTVQLLQKLKKPTLKTDKIVEEVKQILSESAQVMQEIKFVESSLNDRDLKQKKVEIEASLRQIREFDRIESILFQVTQLFLTGREEKGIEFLRSMQITTSMKPFFTLYEYFHQNRGYQQFKSYAMTCLDHFKHVTVPVHVWLDIQLLIAHAFIKTGNINKALLLYKSLAQVHPKLPLTCIPYTTHLQSAITVEDLKNPSCVSDPRNELLKPRRQLAALVCSQPDEATYEPLPKSCTLFSDVAENLPGKFLELTIEVEDSEGSGLKPLPASVTPTGEGANINFSLTTDYRFLYKIGKVTAKYGILLEEGLQALREFHILKQYWMHEANPKAIVWEAVLHARLGNEEMKNLLLADLPPAYLSQAQSFLTNLS